jgi:hypothetical protein
MNDKMSQEKGGLMAAKCPICNSSMRNLTCPTHETICDICGTLYKKNEISCPNCFPAAVPNIQDERTVHRTLVALGELGFGTNEPSAINNGADPHRRKIRQKTEAAIKWLNLPRNKEVELLENVERNSASIASRYREMKEKNSNGQNSHISLEKVVEYSLFSEAKKIGKTIVEVQDALAKAGFKLKLQRFLLRISVPRNVDISLVSMYVNGWKQAEDSFRPKLVGEGPLGMEYSVAFQALLSDTIDRKGRVGEREWVEVRFGNAIIVSDEPAIVDKSTFTKSRFYYVDYPLSSSSSSTSPTKHSRDKVNFLQKGPSTVLLRLNGSKCFALFKSMNQILDLETGPTTLTKKSNDYTSVNSSQPLPLEIQWSIRQHLLLPSKRFPASAALMQRASCLGRVERRSVELFREFLNNSNGRSQRTLAREALTQADKEVFSSLPESLKLMMKSFVTTLPLKRRDRSYTGVKGLLIPSEVLFEDEPNKLDRWESN